MKMTFKGKNFTAIFTNENGYFSLTGDVSGASGAVGQSLVEIDRDFLPLEKLHLCDVETGRPMHAWENAKYALNGPAIGGRDFGPDAAARALHLDNVSDGLEKMAFNNWVHAWGVIKDNEPGAMEELKSAMQEIEEIWLDRVSDLDDDLETLADTYAPENRPEFVEPTDENGDVLPCYEDIDSDDLDRMTALARHLNCNISDVEPARYGENIFEAEGKEFAVLTDSEADDLWDDDLENYIDECLDIPENMKNYFDREAWKRDAKMDGRGHSLGRYDGNEYSSQGIEETYFIYRQ